MHWQAAAAATAAAAAEAAAAAAEGLAAASLALLQSQRSAPSMMMNRSQRDRLVATAAPLKPATWGSGRSVSTAHRGSCAADVSHT